MRKSLSVNEFIQLIDGNLVGESDEKLSGVASLQLSRPGDVSFLGNAKYASQVNDSLATLILVPIDYDQLPANNQVFVKCESPNLEFQKAVEVFSPPAVNFSPMIHPSAYIAPTAQIGKQVHIGPNAIVDEHAIIGDQTKVCAGTYVGQYVQVGDGCMFYPNVSIREGCVIGNHVILHSGCAIGTDGYGYEPQITGEHIKLPQVGIVELGDHVEIGSNSCVDRARFGVTRIGDHVKIDNLCQVGHNCEIGKGSCLMSLVGVSGSTKIGRLVAVYGNAGLAGHLNVGDGATILAKAGIMKDIEPGDTVMGAPAVNKNQFMRQTLAVQKLPDLIKKVKMLEKEIAALKS
ncbi:MAG: UDP-3-O-(3-hydroxymyristoyl)glucosamine N-acyltransferase [Lentisphaeria bacterium]|nr:UDP-3-O-(3-hydroxymyristoyl)glucosamine N-acyltransferase [Lentisphaeria bacterium]